MKNDPVILTIETSLQNGSLSIYRGENEVGASGSGRNPARAEDLLEMIAELLRNKNIRPKEIDLIGVSVGPGSFTGIRVGIATAVAMASGLKCRCVGVSLLDALASHAASFPDSNLNVSNFSNSSPILSALPSGREQVFWQIFFKEKETGISGPRAGSVEELKNFILEQEQGNLTIIAEPSIYQKIQPAFLGSEFTGLDLKFINASDNASKYISIYIRKKISNQAVLNLSGNLSENFYEITPRYAMEVEIGRNK